MLKLWIRFIREICILGIKAGGILEKKNKYDDVFIVLTYRNTDDLIDFIESVQAVVNNYRIIIVNSFYDELSNLKFEKIAKENDCDFLCVENKGYGCGNNRGIEYAIEKYDFERIVISNPDIVIKKYSQDFLSEINNGIIGGRITNLNGKVQNPLRVFHSRLTTNAAYYFYCKNNKFLFCLGIIISKIVRVGFSFGITGRIKKVYAVHGSFLVMPKDTVQKLGQVYDENIFMFCEELDLAARAKIEGIPTYYTTQIGVLHKEDGSIKLSNIKTRDEMRKSCEYVYSKYNKKNCI